MFVAGFVERVNNDVVGAETLRFVAKNEELVSVRVDLRVGAECLSRGVERVVADGLERVWYQRDSSLQMCMSVVGLAISFD
jgi:hypothetical protein